MNQRLRAKLETLPSRPGVYFHKSPTGEVIYVGKAAVLKNRVRSYFRGPHDIKTESLVREIADTDWIETDSETNALFLESEMIKRYMPRYNILLRDDKSSLYVRIDFRRPAGDKAAANGLEKIPLVTTLRQPLDDGADYLGPFYSGSAVKTALRYLRKAFPFFAGKSDIDSRLLRQLNLVPDIFRDNNLAKIPREIDEAKLRNYKKSLRTLARYLSGHAKKIQAEMEKEMKTFADNLDFENAAKIRNQLANLNELKKQIIFGREEFMDISKDQALGDLQKLLGLPEVPRRIEAYDVSHQNGRDVVASMVVATNGVADRREYKKFRLSREINDDTANLREVISRRFSARNADWPRPDLIILDGGKPQNFAVFDILLREKIPVIGRDKSGDHSRNAAVKIVVPTTVAANRSSSRAGIGVVQREQNQSADSAERGRFFSDEVRIIPLENNSHIAKLVARLDDEAHRFAVSYHENLKQKRQTKNALDDITGIGPISRKKLLRKFGSTAKIRESSELEIAKIVGAKLATKIKQNL